MTAPDKPEGLIAGGEQVRAKASEPHPVAGGGEDKSGLAAALQRALHEMKTAKEKGYSLREFDEEDAEVIVAAARAHLLSSPRVEEVRREALEVAAAKRIFHCHNGDAADWDGVADVVKDGCRRFARAALSLQVE